jgi:hypothetical protein
MAEVVYMDLQSGNGGILVDVSRSGLGFQAACPVRPDEPMRFRFSSESIRGIEVTGDLVWTDRDRKRGGLRFGLLPVEVRKQIQLWLDESGRAVPDANNRASYAPSRSEGSASTAGPAVPRRSADSGTGAILWTRDQPGQHPAGSPDPVSAASDVRESLPNSPPPQLPFAAPRENLRSNSFSESGFASPRALSEWNDVPRSSPKLAAIALTAILAIAATIAGLSIFYKQEAGETLIRWGETISGQRHEQTANPKPDASVPPGSSTESASAYPSLAAPELRGPTTGSGTGSNASVGPSTKGSAAGGSTPNAEALQPPSAQGPQLETGAAPAPTTPPSQSATPRVRGTESSASLAAREAADSAVKSADREANIPHDQGGGKTELALAHNYLARATGPKDRDVAMQLLWVAVGDGNTEAELELADLYLRGGRSSGKNCTQARILFRAAYNNGNLVAGQRLAELPDYGCR